MDIHRFDTLLRSGADSFSVEIGPNQTERLYRYYQELFRWSKKINLISKNADEEEIVENHFVDSAALLSLIRNGGNLLDIGSGAGFPGLVCKAINEDLKVSLVEPRLKRVSFLKHIIRTLDLSDIDVYALRLEDGVVIPGEETCEWIVSRAVTDIADFLAMCGRFRQQSTSVVCMKGPRWREEFDERQEAANGWELKDIHAYRLPRSGARRNLLVFQGKGSSESVR